MKDSTLGVAMDSKPIFTSLHPQVETNGHHYGIHRDIEDGMAATTKITHSVS